MTLLAAASLPKYVRASRSSAWPTTQGSVTRSGLREVRVKFGTTGFAPEIEYEYAVGERRFIGHRIEFGRDHLGRERAEEILRRYPAGGVTAVSYDESHPQDAVLVPGLDPEWRLLFRMTIVYLGVGAVLSLWGVWRLRRA
jgi:hypothetical protein